MGGREWTGEGVEVGGRTVFRLVRSFQSRPLGDGPFEETTERSDLGEDSTVKIGVVTYTRETPVSGTEHKRKQRECRGRVSVKHSR